MPLFSVARLEDFSARLLAAGGLTAEEAAITAKSLVGANLRGYDSHGVMRIPYYVQAIIDRETVSQAPLEILQRGASRVTADAHWGIGQVQAMRLLEILMNMARTEGAATGTMMHSGHIGRLGEYCERAAAEGLISIVMVNSHGGVVRVAPPGGKAPRLSTNPLAIGVPNGGEPLLLDFSTSATAEGKVRVKKIAGQQCPPGWLLDSEGRPTTNPNDLYADPPGSILPMGGDQAYKGFGLALMIDILCGALSGGVCAREVPYPNKGNCVFMQVFDPSQFGGAEHFAAEVKQLVDYIKSSPTVPGVKEILVPGDPERRLSQRLAAEGIAIEDGNWSALVKLAEKLNVSVPT